MKTPVAAIALLAALPFAGCGKKPAAKPAANAPAPTTMSAAERAALAGPASSRAIGAAPKQTIDRAKATLDAAQARETQATADAVDAAR